MRVGVIGCGSIGIRHIRNLRRHPAIDGVFAYDVVPERSQEAERHGAVAMGDLVALGRARPDIVFVCTPASSHEEDVTWAIAQGADVFVEKPLAISLEAASRVVQAANGSGRLIAVGYMLRFDTALQRTREAIARGEVGRILLARCEFGQYLPAWRPTRDYRETPTARADLGGGILLEASHEIDALLWIFGDIGALSASLMKQSDLDIDVEDTVVALLEFRSGVACELHLDLVQRGYRRELRAIGSEGNVEWRLSDGATAVDAEGRITRLAGPTDPDELYVRELDDIVSAIQQRRAPLVPGEDGVRALRIVEAIRRSHRERRRIELAPQ